MRPLSDYFRELLNLAVIAAFIIAVIQIADRVQPGALG